MLMGEIMQKQTKQTMLSRTGGLLAGLCISAAGLTPTLTMAQQPQLEEIIVTAERRETSLQDTPVSINSFSDVVLDAAGITNIQELQNLDPSLVSAGNRGSGDSNLNMAIRGIGQRSSRTETDRGVGLYIDEVYYAVTYGSNLQFTDVERIEVLRGPQGTLFGRNNTGGAVRLFSRKAQLGATYGDVSVTAGEYGRLDGEAILNVGLSDTAAFRLVAASEQSDGYMDFVDADGNKTDRESLGAKDNFLVRGSFRFQPIDALTIDASVTSTSSENSGLTQDLVGMKSPDASYGTRIRDAILNETGVPLQVDDPRIITDSPYTLLDSCLLDGDGLFATRVTPTDPNNFTDGCDTSRDVDTLSAYLNITYEFGNDLTFKSISGYTDIEAHEIQDWSVFGTYMRDENSDIDFWSQEFQLSGMAFSDRLTWVTGATLFQQSAYEDKNIWVVGPSPAFTPMYDRNDRQNVEVDSWGVFAQGTYALTDQTNLTLGARYSEDKKDFWIQRTNRIDGFIPTAKATWDDTNFRVVLDHHWNDNVMTYVTFSDGYKSGAFPTNISPVCQRALFGDPAVCDDARELVSNADIEPQAPEQVENIEIGLRSEFMDRIRLNVTAFTMDYTDLQRRSREDDPNDPDCTGGFENGICDARYLDGAISAEIKGLETEALFRLTDSLTFTANLAYLDTSITDNEGATDLNIGDPLEAAPEFNYTFGILHNFVFANGMTLDSNLYYAHTDEYLPPFAANLDEKVSDYSTLSARVELGSADGRWQLALGGTNLTDETISYGLNHWPGFFGGIVQEGRGAPRSIYVNGRYHFGDL